MDKEWINDAVYYCENCDFTFKVYGLNVEPNVNFCPSCGSREMESIEADEEL